MLELLGDYYRVLGIAEQPHIEYARPVVYYWFEVFRRATIIQSPSSTPCWHIVLDVYRKIDKDQDGERNIIIDVHEITTLKSSRLKKCETVLRYILCNKLNAHNCWLECHEQGDIFEAISFHILICGFSEQPYYQLIERAYVEIVSLVEKRDPLSTPLWVEVKEIMSHKPV